MNNHLLLAYTWSTGNIGDIGITPGALRLIGKQKPDLPVWLLAGQAEDHPHYRQVQRYYEKFDNVARIIPNRLYGQLSANHADSHAWQEFIGRWGIHKVRAFQEGCIPSFEAEQMADDMLDRFSRAVYDYLLREHPDDARAFSEAGFVLYNSGMTLNFGRVGMRNLENTLKMALPLLIARVLGIPYGINGQSFEAIDWPTDLIHRKLFQDAAFVYCRDSDSLRYLQQRGLLNRNSGFRPDSTFFFQQFDETWADAYMRANGLEDKRFISVILRLPDPEKTGFDPTPGAVHAKGYSRQDMVSGAISGPRLHDHMEKVKTFIEDFVSGTGMKALICHETRHTLTRAKERLWKRLSPETQKRCVYLDEFWSPDQAYSIIKRTRILVSMEMHSVIMSLNVGTPAVHIPFAEAGRKREMMRDIGVGDWLLDIDECLPGEITDVAIRIHDRYTEAEARIRSLLAGLELRADAVLGEVWSNWREKN